MSKKKERKPSVRNTPNSQESISAVKDALQALSNIVSKCENKGFVTSIEVNLSAIRKKVNKSYNSSQRADVLKALREGRTIKIE